MSTATVPPATVRDCTARAVTPSAARLFLTRFTTTLLPLLAGLAALELGWQLLAGSTWPAAAAAVTGWVLAVTAWLRRGGWRAGAVLAVVWAPAAVLAGPAAGGWLSPAGLLLWGPVSTVPAVALVMAGAEPGSVPPTSPRR